MDKKDKSQDPTNEIGYKSILKKSVHKNDLWLRDTLMMLTNLSEENTIRLYIENLNDF